MKVKIKKLNENAVIPTYGTEFSAGADLYACIDEDIEIIADGIVTFFRELPHNERTFYETQNRT
jgi:dUTPase